MHTIIVTGFLLCGLANLLPVLGVLGEARLQLLYGITPEDRNLVLLLRHRAVLLGIVGVLLMVAAFRPAWRPPAMVAGLVEHDQLPVACLQPYRRHFANHARRLDRRVCGVAYSCSLAP